MKKRIELLLLVMLALPVLAACERDTDARFASAADDVAESDRYGGTAVVGLIGDMPDINPLTSTEFNASQIQRFMLFTPLVTYDENFEPVPVGARSWELNDDSTAITFHLRDDIYWHDGRQTTAYDWEYTYRIATTPETGYPNTAFFQGYGEAEAVDSLTFRVEMRPHAQYMDTWWNLFPVPRHILEGTEPAQIRTHPYSTREPVGNGPFRFAGRATGQSWTFEANEEHPDELGGRPYLDRIVYRYIPEPTTLLTELLTGSIDYYIQVNPDQIRSIENSDRARLTAFNDRAFVLIGWNQRIPMFEDERVRRALTMAIDRDQIINAVLNGYGEVANHSVPPIFPQFDGEAGNDLTYDPEEAVELLAEAGWERDDDGVLRNDDGDPFQFTLMTNEGNQIRADITQIVQAQLRRIGIQVRPQILEWGAMLSRVNNPDRRDFEAMLIGWVTEFRIDDSDLFHCDKLEAPYQWVGHCSPELDRLMDTLQVIPDRDAATPVWHEYQRQLAAEQPYSFIYFQDRISGVNQRLQNVNPDPRGDWVGVSRWFILPEMRGRRASR